MKKFICLFLVIMLLGLAACSGNQSSNTQTGSSTQNQTRKMKFALASPKDHPMSQGAFKFAELVKEKSGGTIQVEVFTDGVLGGDLATVDAMRAGTIDGGAIATAPLASVSKRFDIFELPFLFKDRETAFRVLDGPVGKDVLGDLESLGLIGLDYWENGFRHMTNNKHEVKNIADIKDIKIRTQENEMHMQIWKTLGASPQSVPFTELFTALEQGVVDGQENPYTNIQFTKIYEVQKYLTNTGHVYNVNATIFSKKFWDSLSKEEKQIIKDASSEATTYQRQISGEQNDSALQALIEEGVVVTDLTQEAREEIIETVQPIYDQAKEKVGADIIDKVVEAAKN
ncbi:TRAP transporter substrate-binding protein [Metabacillus arenae]|uniref:TRAP transporter substrate-binding protein n=1 Tax=Metabacillus arenae TaxID=2771434 RepID=A0A926NM11_9BACI|nr:TRAP transporter substrate-binding protein [Metabacillus arenae]MBD1382418.1 TRAP transporter substrate-binding protein [Metabacillus arenae]